MVDRWLRWMRRRGSHRSISRDGTPYMERYFLLRLGRFALFLHHFKDSDLDDVHDHPWAWARLIIKGSYREHHHDGTFTDCSRGDFVWRSARELHWVELNPAGFGQQEVWTLFLHGERSRVWGFIDQGKWAPHHSSRRAQGANASKPAGTTTGWIFPRYPSTPPSPPRRPHP